jgi:hypothetical protein
MRAGLRRRAELVGLPTPQSRVVNVGVLTGSGAAGRTGSSYAPGQFNSKLTSLGQDNDMYQFPDTSPT